MRIANTLSTHSADSVAVQQPATPVAMPVRSLLRDFLTWVAYEPRTHAEAMEVWRSNCPRFTIWEDALADGLIQVAYGRGVQPGGPSVDLTEHGRAILAGS